MALPPSTSFENRIGKSVIINIEVAISMFITYASLAGTEKYMGPAGVL